MSISLVNANSSSQQIAIVEKTTTPLYPRLILTPSSGNHSYPTIIASTTPEIEDFSPEKYMQSIKENVEGVKKILEVENIKRKAFMQEMGIQGKPFQHTQETSRNIIHTKFRFKLKIEFSAEIREIVFPTPESVLGATAFTPDCKMFIPEGGAISKWAPLTGEKQEARIKQCIERARVFATIRRERNEKLTQNCVKWVNASSGKGEGFFQLKGLYS